MKKYVTFEKKGNIEVVITVEADTDDEAYQKAFETFIDLNYYTFCDDECPKGLKKKQLIDEGGEEVVIGDLDGLFKKLKKNFKSATLYDGDNSYVEVRYDEEIDGAKELVKALGFTIDEDQTGYSTGSDYTAYYIWLK